MPSRQIETAEQTTTGSGRTEETVRCIALAEAIGIPEPILQQAGRNFLYPSIWRDRLHDHRSSECGGFDRYQIPRQAWLQRSPHLQH
jgi:hypothetical protein